ncbi:MAG: hypothetical protein V2I48_17650 [Xanthomonadales bacterium]|nr:hypothetical protein [Xanthomonadales bacterium]
MKEQRIEDSFALVVELFGSWKSRIEQSVDESEAFRSLCEDYAVCAIALEKWQASNAAISAQRQQEYSELLAELGKEIHQWLEYRYRSDTGN